MEEGYIYCFSNPIMDGIYKVGVTQRNPLERLKEANSSNTWKPPLPYEIEFAKKVINPKQKEKTIHKLLTQYTDRINPQREFFRITLEEIRTFFDLMDGEEYNIEELDTYNENSSEFEYETNQSPDDNKNKCRDLQKCLYDKQQIRHVIGINKIWFGVYNRHNNTIIANNKEYSGKSPLNQFACDHYKVTSPNRTSSCNAWKECECEINNTWVSMFDLPILE